MLTGRNLAKYMHAAERFALGQATTQDSYLTAANQRDDADIFYVSTLRRSYAGEDLFISICCCVLSFFVVVVGENQDVVL